MIIVHPSLVSSLIHDMTLYLKYIVVSYERAKYRFRVLFMSTQVVLYIVALISEALDTCTAVDSLQ
jgi:hypothetical protein